MSEIGTLTIVSIWSSWNLRSTWCGRDFWRPSCEALCWRHTQLKWMGNFHQKHLLKNVQQGRIIPSSLLNSLHSYRSGGFYCKSVSPEGRELGRSGRIGVEGTLFCKQWKQVVARVPSAMVPMADAAHWCKGRGPEQKQKPQASKEDTTVHLPGC